MSTLAVRFTILAVLVALGCREQDRNYCADALNHNCLNDDAGSTQCSSDEQCAPKVCDLAGSKACVQCTIANATACAATTPVCGPNNACVQCTAEKPGACTATTPVCGTNDACRGCAVHAECSSNVCLADGSCAAATNVAYVAPGGSGTCGKTDPCGTLDLALQTGRPYVKFAAGVVKDNKTTTIDGKTVTILADAGAKLDRDGDGAILVVQSSSSTTPTSVQIFDLEIAGATGVPGGDAVRLVANGGTPALALTHVIIDGNQGVGVVATGGVLSVSRSTFAQNNGGGVSESSGTFVVVGNVFFGNGGIGSSVGGIAITTMPSSTNRLEFNSFNQNTTQATIGPAIHCVVGSFVARNNIMSDNGTLTQPDQFGGSCTHTYSIARPGMMLPGGTNSASDPLFADPSKGDLHITSVSPARRGADPNSDLSGIAAHDIDGMARTSPADMGAYQFKPPGAAAINTSTIDTEGHQQ